MKHARSSTTKSKPLQIQILISGTGSNALNIIHAQHEYLTGLIHVTQVISNNPRAQGLVAAQHKGITTACVDHQQAPSREHFEQALIQAIESQPYELIVLAGFMRVLSPSFVQHFAGQIVNIHPSLLPAYKGLHTHQRVLEAQETQHGVSVHLVIPDLDSGPVIGQASLQIGSNETQTSLQKRIQRLEHWLYPYCLGLIASGQIQLSIDSVQQRLHSLEQDNATGVILCTEETILAMGPNHLSIQDK